MVSASEGSARPLLARRFDLSIGAATSSPRRKAPTIVFGKRPLIPRPRGAQACRKVSMGASILVAANIWLSLSMKRFFVDLTHGDRSLYDFSGIDSPDVNR